MIVAEERFMRAAIAQAKQARAAGDYAIGAVVVKSGVIIAVGGNRVKVDHGPTAHAEVVAIRKATQLSEERHLQGCVLYTTNEPCPMCATAAMWARMSGIVFGARIDDMISFNRTHGNQDFTWRTIYFSASQINDRANPKLEIVEAFMRSECNNLFHTV